MLGLKREIIKERDAVGDVEGEGGTKEIRVGDTGGDVDRCNCLFSTGAAGSAFAKTSSSYHLRQQTN